MSPHTSFQYPQILLSCYVAIFKNLVKFYLYKITNDSSAMPNSIFMVQPYKIDAYFYKKKTPKRIDAALKHVFRTLK